MMLNQRKLNYTRRKPVFAKFHTTLRHNLTYRRFNIKIASSISLIFRYRMSNLICKFYELFNSEPFSRNMQC